MILSARILQDVCSVNVYKVAQNAIFSQGDTTYIYLQLIDASVDTAMQGFNPSGRRYIPATGATLTVTLDSLNLANKLVRSATMPFAQDGSIWKLSILATDKLNCTSPLKLTLNESGKVTTGQLQNAILAYPKEV